MSTASEASARGAEAAQITQALALEQRSLWQDAVRQFVKNRLAVGGLILIALFVFAALFGPYVAPYDFLDQELEKPVITRFLELEDGDFLLLIIKVFSLQPNPSFFPRRPGHDFLDIGKGDDFGHLAFASLGKRLLFHLSGGV